jgi:sugar O-acyltransferase (sialic acid O-acetyltransferase NeuD family)
MKLVIYGAGGLGREVLSLLRALRAQWNFIGYVDDGIPPGTQVGDACVLGGMDWLASEKDSLAVVMGLADPSIKASLYIKLSKLDNIKFPVLVHPLAYVDPSATLAEGSVVSAFCSISVDAVLGICSFFNVGAQIGHDSVVGDFGSVMPHVDISGNVTIGPRTLVGVGTKILQGLRIGSDATVGIGSVVLNNVPDGCTVLGYPAREVKKGREG